MDLLCTPASLNLVATQPRPLSTSPPLSRIHLPACPMALDASSARTSCLARPLCFTWPPLSPSASVLASPLAI